MNAVQHAYELIRDWRGERYRFGTDVLDSVGAMARALGKRPLVVSNGTYLKPVLDRVLASLAAEGLDIAGGRVVPDAKPNAPREDVYRIESYILHHQPDCIVAIGGGSTLDACKAADALACLGEAETPEIDHYFGTGVVSDALARSGKRLIPLLAVQTSASSGAHLTKYANITDPVVGQKKLIVDDALIPSAALFDYSVTASMPLQVSMDGALDAIAHTFEVFCGVKPEGYDRARDLAVTAIDLVLGNAGTLLKEPGDLAAREALGLATDLGGYAIMIGGTNGAHLTSFSLVDLVAHGTACGLMNPYYAVFYAPAIQPQLREIAQVFCKHGFIDEDSMRLEGRALALAVAEGMMAFSRSIHAPTTLRELQGFTPAHKERILSAAKDPQLRMKLQNMPVAMTADDVDAYMAPVIQAAIEGRPELVVNKA